jgi:hypothetical protein
MSALGADFPFRGGHAASVLLATPDDGLRSAGPDKGQGGKHLLVAPGQPAPKAQGYRIVQMKTNSFFAPHRWELL